MKSLFVAGVIAVGSLLGGCATIINGSSQKLAVDSNVKGATVLLNGQPLGKTPLLTEIKRGKEGAKLAVQADGFQPYEVTLNRKMSGAFFGNILSGGLLGSSTDSSTGAMYEYEPGTYFASLTPLQGSPQARESWRRREELR